MPGWGGGGEFGASDAGQHAGQGFEQGDLAAKLGEDGRRFEPDVAPADDDDIAHAAVNLAHQLVTIGAGADGVDAGELGAGAGEAARIAAGRPDQLAVAQGLAGGEG